MGSTTRKELEKIFSNSLPFGRENIFYDFQINPSNSEYPTIQEFTTALPAIPKTKARYGVEWFDAKWDQLTGKGQQQLFQLYATNIS